MTFVCVPLSYQHLRQVEWFFFLLLCRSARRPLLALVLVAAAASPSFAQQFATLNLTVTAPSGSVIPQANVSAEFLNLLNRVNVQDVDQVYGAAEFSSPIPRRYEDGVTSPANPTFGTPTFAEAARQIQLSLKVTFKQSLFLRAARESV
jgi:hypothetical protein